MSAILIRDMRDDDRPTLYRFVTELLAHELLFEPNRTAEREPNVRHFDAVHAELVANGGFILVAEVNSHPIGYLSVIYRIAGAFIQERHRRYAHVEDCFVSVEHRGTGAGRALFTAAEARVRRDGVTSIRLSAVTGNTMAHHAYQAWGFKPYATEYIVRLE